MAIFHLAALSLSFFLATEGPHPTKPSKSLADAVNDPKLIPSTGAAVIRAQILLCRAKFSVGQIDGSTGTNFRRAVLGFQGAHQIPATGVVNKATWKALNLDTGPAVVAYRITTADLAGPFVKIPNDWAEMAKLPKMGYESVDDELGERFHSSPALLHKLNPNKRFEEVDTEIMVPHVQIALNVRAASLVVSRSESTVTALDGRGKVIAQFPATTGSDHDPLPIGEWKVTDIHRDPTFSYNPDLFWNAGAKDAKETIAPGPEDRWAWFGSGSPRSTMAFTAPPSPPGSATRNRTAASG